MAKKKTEQLTVDQKGGLHIQSHVCIVLTFIWKLISFVVFWRSIQDLQSERLRGSVGSIVGKWHLLEVNESKTDTTRF